MNYKDYTFQDNNLFNYGCSSINEDSLHLCVEAVSIDKTQAKAINLEKPNATLITSPTNSTNTGTGDSNPPSSQAEVNNWVEGVFDNSPSEFIQGEEEVYFPHIGMIDEQMAVTPEALASTPVFTSEGFEEVSMTPESSEFNVMEVEQEVATVAETPSTTSTKAPQSQFKNKPKELLEKAVAVLNEFTEMKPLQCAAIEKECMKSADQWIAEGEVLRQQIAQFEALSGSENPKEVKDAKKIKKTVLQALSAKQYCCFVELYKFKDEINECRSDILDNFNSIYKKKISQSYFRDTEFKAEDLFYWVLLHQIALVMLPQDQQYIELVPLNKQTVFLGTWMFQSPMNQKNKELYKQGGIRQHLREVLIKAQTNLMEQASVKMEPEMMDLLTRICSTLAGGVESAERSQRPVYSVVRSRAIPVHIETVECACNKRSSNRCAVKQEKITKKVNKDRK